MIRSTCYGSLRCGRSVERRHTHPVRKFGVADHLVQEGTTVVLSDHVWTFVMSIHTRTSFPADSCQCTNSEQAIVRTYHDETKLGSLISI